VTPPLASFEARTESAKKRKPDTVLNVDELVKQRRRFGTIYADPPWTYRNRSSRAAAANHYQTLTRQEISALPVAELATPNCHLHLWATVASPPLFKDS
jgi:MT-A70